jgi:hypothetical protein
MTLKILDNQALRDKLETLRAKNALSPEAEEEKRLLAEIAAEEAKARATELEELEDRIGAENPGGPVEGKDLDAAGMFVMRGPSRASWLNYEAKVKAKKITPTDDTNLVLEAMLYPDPKGALTSGLFDRFPLIATSLSEIVLRLGGYNIETRAKRR